MEQGKQISYFDKRVLVVDDDRFFRLLMARIFRQWGYTAELCSSGEEAISILKKSDAPRFAMIDWLMPGADGAEVCRHIKQFNQNRFTYVMIATGENQETAAQIAFEAEADDFISKPVNLSVLQTRIRSAVRLIEYELNQEREKQILEQRIIVLERLAYEKNESPNRRVKLNPMEAQNNIENKILSNKLLTSS